MIKAIKKGAGIASRKAADYVGSKVQTRIREKTLDYRKKLNSVIWQQFLYMFAFVLIIFGIINFFSKTYNQEFVFILIGVIILIIGFFVSKKSN